MEALSDKDGHFEATRGLCEMIVHLQSADKKLVGIQKITADAQVVTFTVGPTATATGRLIGATTGCSRLPKMESG